MTPLALLLLIALGFFVAYQIIKYIQRILFCTIVGAFLIGVVHPVLAAAVQASG